MLLGGGGAGGNPRREGFMQLQDLLHPGPDQGQTLRR